MTEAIAAQSKATILARAKKALEECDLDREKAAQLLSLWLEDDEDLQAAVNGFGVWSAIRGASQEMNHESIRQAHIDKQQKDRGADALEGLGRSNERLLMKRILTSGVVLEKAYRPDIEHEVDFYASQRRGMARMEKWFKRILDAMGDTRKMVGNVLTEDELKEMLD